MSTADGAELELCAPSTAATSVAAATKPNLAFTWAALRDVWLNTVPKGTCPLRCGKSIVRAKLPAPMTSSRLTGDESVMVGGGNSWGVERGTWTVGRWTFSA